MTGVIDTEATRIGEPNSIDLGVPVHPVQRYWVHAHVSFVYI